MLGMENCVLTLMNVLILLVIVTLVMQFVLMVWASLPVHVHLVVLEMKHCVLTLMHMLMLLVLQMCHMICMSETPILYMGLGGKKIVSILRDRVLVELMVKCL